MLNDVHREEALQARRHALIALGAGLLMVGCAGLGSGPQTLTISQADLTRWAERQFPLDKRVLEVLDLKLQAPRISVLPEKNRLAGEIDLTGKDRLGGRMFTGKLMLDSALRLDVADQSVRLSDVKVNQLDFEGVPTGWQSAVRGSGPMLVEQLFENLVIYRFKPHDLQKAAAAGLRPQSLRITPRGVELLLQPLGAP